MSDLYSAFLRGDPEADLWQTAKALASMVFDNGDRRALDALSAGTDRKREPELRLAAVKALGLLGRKGAAAQRALRKLMKDEDTEVAKWAIVALEKQRDRALPVVNDLIEMLQQDSELTDYLQHAFKAITGEPSPITWPRKCNLLYLGSWAFDDPRYQGGRNFIMGKNLNPRYVDKVIGKKSAQAQKRQSRVKPTG
jgi:hypothetical protein